MPSRLAHSQIARPASKQRSPLHPKILLWATLLILFAACTNQNPNKKLTRAEIQKIQQDYINEALAATQDSSDFEVDVLTSIKAQPSALDPDTQTELENIAAATADLKTETYTNEQWKFKLHYPTFMQTAPLQPTEVQAYQYHQARLSLSISPNTLSLNPKEAMKILNEHGTHFHTQDNCYIVLGGFDKSYFIAKAYLVDNHWIKLRLDFPHLYLPYIKPLQQLVRAWKVPS